MRTRHLPAAVRQVLVAVTLVLAAALGAGAAPAHAAAKPTVVLVHGAWADASSWTGVIERLQRAGYRVVAPPNPLRGLASDVAYLNAFLGTIPGPVVVAGHSYGGAVVTGAATGNPNVEALVYVNAFIPDAGDTIRTLVASAPGSALAVEPATVFDFAPFPGAPEGVVDVYLKPRVVIRSVAQDLPRRAAAALAATQRPIALNALAEPSGPPAWESVPAYAIVGTADRVIPLAGQLAMARRAGARITRLDASHVSLISRPGAVSRVIARAARRTAER